MLSRFALLLGVAIAVCAPASPVLHAADEPAPTLASSSYYGGFGFDEANDVAVDANGFVYVAGRSDSPTGAGSDGFVVKVSPDGSHVVYATRIGGSAFEVATGIAVDPTGGVWVVGTTTSADLPVTPSAFQSTLQGDSDAWIAKLDADGTLTYASYFGGSSFENGSAIAVGATGMVYAAGSTGSPDLPLANGLQHNYSGGFSDAFVVRLSGTVVDVATYFGGTGDDYVSRVVVDANGVAYLGGYTNSYDLPLALAMQGAFGGGTNDGFVTRLAPDLTQLTLSTYLGGADSDTVIGLAVDPSGAMFATGSTWSFDFPTTSSYKPFHSGGVSDAFVTKLPAGGNVAQYSTFFGEDGYDVGVQVAVDASGRAHITGQTDSTMFPLVGEIQNQVFATDAFYAELSADGRTLLRSTPLGGTAVDLAQAFAMNAAGDAWIVGRTESTDFPLANAFQAALNGSSDAFVSRLVFPSTPPTVNHAPIADAGADQVVFTNGCATNVVVDASHSSDVDGDALQYTWSGAFGSVGGAVLTQSLLPGTYTFTLTVDDGHGGIATDSVTVSVVDNVGPEIGTATATPNVLTQANHQMVDVVMSVSLTGTCDAGSSCQIVNVTSNEPVNGLGDGDTAPDWQVTGALTLKVRSEKGQKSTGRIYTITVECVDAAGNRSRRDVTVLVPGNSKESVTAASPDPRR